MAELFLFLTVKPGCRTAGYITIEHFLYDKELFKNCLAEFDSQ